MSSDSDDDFYGNIIKKRDKILSNYTAKMAETKEDSLLDDSILLDEICKTKSESVHDISLSDRRITKRENGVKRPNKRKNESLDSDFILSSDEVQKTKKNKSKKVNTRNQARKTVSNIDDSVIEIIDEPINDLISRRGKTPRGRGKSTPKRKKGWILPRPRRSCSKRNEINRELLASLPPLRDCSPGHSSDVLINSDDSIVEIIDETPKDSRGKRGKKTPRGRGRGRGRKTSRGIDTGTPINTQNRQGPTLRSLPRNHSNIPTYSVGNTEEYEDDLEDVALFSSKQNKNDTLLNNTGAEENEELSVKVYWQSIDVYKFNIRKYQKLKEIFEYFSERENIPMEKLLFTYDDRIIKQDDTPDSIDYNIAKFIDGGHTISSINNLTSKVTSKVKTSGLKIKFQYQKSQKHLEIYLDKDEKLSVAMTKCAEFLEVPLTKLKFVFDGDVISGSETMRDLDMEGDECIDVKIVD